MGLTAAAATVSALALLIALRLVWRLRDRRLLVMPLALAMILVHTALQLLPSRTVHASVLDNSLTLAESLLSLTLVLVVGIVIDSLRRAEGAARDHNRLLQTWVDSLPQPLCVVDPTSRRVLRANSVLRLRSQETAPLCFALTHGRGEPCDGPDHPCPLDDVVSSRRSVVVEHMHRTDDGRTRHWEVRAHPILDENGQVTQVIEHTFDITAQRRTEKALAEANRKLEWAFDSALEGLYLTDPQGRIIMANQMMATMLGFSSAAELRDHLVDVAHIPYLEAVRRREIDGMLRHSEEVRGVESQVCRRDRKIFWVSESVRVLRGDDGSVTGVEGALVDVTEWKQMEQALGRAVERLAALSHIERTSLTTAAADSIARSTVEAVLSVVHSDLAFVVRFSASDSAEVIAAEGDWWPTAGDTLPQQAFAEEWAGGGPSVRRLEDVAALPQRSPLLEMLAQQGLHSVLRTLLCADGQAIGELVAAAARPGAFSQEDLWVIQEMADALAIGLHQAKLRETLLAEQSRLRLALHALPTGVVLLDDRGRLLLANPAGQSFLPALASGGLTAPVSELAGRTLADLASVSRTGQWTELQVREGPPRVFEVLANPLTLATGVSGFMVAIRDRTREREVERQLGLQERLAGIGQLATGIAHDFNNLLQGTVMDAERLLGITGLPAAVIEAGRAISARAQRGARLIRQILDFTNTATVPKQCIELGALLDEHLALLRRTIPEHIELRFDPPADKLWIEGDATQIQQVVANLVINARDAMPGGGEVRIELMPVRVEVAMAAPVVGMGQGGWAHLCVRDNGTGIPPEVQPRIFEPFFTTKKPGEGTGLGLSQVYGIVKRHGGSIAVDSEPGMGATFSLYLPLAQTVTPQPALAMPDTGASEPGHGELLLVVEDDDELLALISAALVDLGYRIVGTRDPRRALELVTESEERFALVLSDLMMPGMTGLELCARLGTLDPTLRVVIMSGYPADDALGPDHANLVAWMTKPFSTARLGTVMARALHDSSPRDRSPDGA